VSGRRRSRIVLKRKVALSVKRAMGTARQFDMATERKVKREDGGKGCFAVNAPVKDLHFITHRKELANV